MATFVLLGLLSFVFFAIHVVGETFDLHPLRGIPWLYSEWTRASVGMTLGMMEIYRWTMSRERVDWRAANDPPDCRLR